MAYVATGYWVSGYAELDLVDGFAVGTPSQCSIVTTLGYAVGTSSSNGLGTGNVSSITIDAVSAVGIGTSVGNGIGAGAPSSISIGTVTASAIGTTQANGAATGTPSVFTISAPSAVAGVFVYVRAPSGSGPSVLKPASKRVSNVVGQTRTATYPTKRG